MDILEKIEESNTVYEGLIFDVEKIKTSLPNGKEAYRDVVRHKGASGVIALDKDLNIVLEKQYRIAFDQVLIELPAGKIDPGESPLECAKRELKEETGIVANKMTYIMTVASSPGFSDELVHLYLAEDLQEGAASPDSDENLIVWKEPLAKAKKRVFEGEITNGLAVVGILAACQIKGI